MLKKILFFISIAGLCCVVQANDIRISMQQTQISGMPLTSKGMSFDWDNGRSHGATIAMILVGAYAVTTIYVLHSRYLLNNMSAWNNWKNSIPLSELATLPQKNVYEMLAKSIEMRYSCPSGTSAMNLPQFLRDTTSEIETLSAYKSVANTLNSIYLTPLFFISPDSIKQADEKIKRLRFLQSIIVNELEPHDCVQRFSILNYVSQKGLFAMQRVLGRHH